ncbi:hypothetical protein [Vibrio breoganii]|uniref:hypothetical protein n=1 Tax=Vibrio breoganii TaxID=553239 RepID=UPI000C86765E|nr:hypothetical protein [Vibrio breoganii]PML94454.1 hypothetical protein BCT64_11480 [Vibrio breoganii]PMN65763.1 hypothetical protein BCT28_06075 [Vibrio breoganii]
MNKNQVKQLESSIHKLNDVEVGERLAEAFPNTAEHSEIKIQELSGTELLDLFNLVRTLCNDMMKYGTPLYLPLQINAGTDFGGSNLINDINQLAIQIQGKQFPNSIPTMLRLLHYFRMNGLYKELAESPETKAQIDEARINETEKQLRALSKQLQNDIQQVQALKAEIDNYTKSKHTEFKEIEDLVASSRKLTESIREQNSSVKEMLSIAQQQIKQSESDQNDLHIVSNDLSSTITQYKKSLSGIEAEIEQQQQEFERLRIEFQTHLDNIQEKHDTYKLRSAFLDDLIGREVGASLFETFKQRKIELDAPIFWWRTAVGVSAALSLAWVVGLFWGTSLADLTWQSLAVNSLKTLPAFAVLYFSISQYTKERHFQEEYAFKSAVALTVNSYASQLKGEENQDKLIMESVEQIYRTPIDKKLDQNFTAKEVKQQVATVKDIVREAKAMMKNN